MENGNLNVGPVTLRRAVTRSQDGSEKQFDGNGTATLQLDTEDLSQLIVSMDFKSWPVPLGKSAWADMSRRRPKRW